MSLGDGRVHTVKEFNDAHEWGCGANRNVMASRITYTSPTPFVEQYEAPRKGAAKFGQVPALQGLQTGAPRLRVTSPSCIASREGGGIDCPECGLGNPATTLRCDCGYDFVIGSVFRGVPAQNKGQRSERKGSVRCRERDRRVVLGSAPGHPGAAGSTRSLTSRIVLLLMGIILGVVARVPVGWLGVAIFAAGLFIWAFLAIGAGM